VLARDLGGPHALSLTEAHKPTTPHWCS